MIAEVFYSEKENLNFALKEELDKRLKDFDFLLFSFSSKYKIPRKKKSDEKNR